MLGIPTVQDRWIQQMLLQVLQPIFDPTFSEHSYGFRPNRGAQDAVRAAQNHVKEGKDWVVDMDITKFFDRVNHDILMNRVGQTIRDKRVLRLIGNYLRAGVMIEGVVVASEEGTSIWTRWIGNSNGGDWHSAATPMTATFTLAVAGRQNECWRASRNGSKKNCDWKSTRAKAEWGNRGNGSSLGSASTGKAGLKRPRRVWSG
jgi:hypothetical protein